MNRKLPPFMLDTREKKLLGVCAGIGRAVNVDPTFVRIAFVAVPLLTFVSFWQAIIAYVILGVIGSVARNRSVGRDERSDFDRMEDSGKKRQSIHGLRTDLDGSDRRMMAIDDHLNSQNHELAREIEALRKEEEGK
ncbi:MAG TPA: PspC domain-containing protein [Sphingomicrobium sp.]|jgi:phage shock protein PspC (stress-responsive transcriptional regulator)|nr:PspC domain-containing protein [Sphingomicrobium sp.]